MATRSGARNHAAICTEDIARSKRALKTGHSRQSSSMSTCTGSSSNSEAQCWADISVDSLHDDAEARHLVQDEDFANDTRSITTKILIDADTCVQADTKGNYPSVGSRQHNLGRCKPCAFFHTEGCKSASDCLFCHLCPPNEKQRRKRLYRQLCQRFQRPLAAQGSSNLQRNMTYYTPPDTLQIHGAAFDSDGHQFWEPAASIAEGCAWQFTGATAERSFEQAQQCQPALFVMAGVCPPFYIPGKGIHVTSQESGR